jgi:hypothetical protein
LIPNQISIKICACKTTTHFLLPLSRLWLRRHQDQILGRKSGCPTMTLEVPTHHFRPSDFWPLTNNNVGIIPLIRPSLEWYCSEVTCKHSVRCDVSTARNSDLQYSFQGR